MNSVIRSRPSSIAERFPISLTRNGWRNPLALPRSDLQRVAYAIEDETLIRYYWQVLDRAEDSMPVRQVMLEDVYLLEFSAIDISGNSHSFWPLMAEMAMDPEADLAAISVRLEVRPFGELVRVWDVPGMHIYGRGPDFEPPPDEAP
jgi:general secretion pathway protein J